MKNKLLALLALAVMFCSCRGGSHNSAASPPKGVTVYIDNPLANALKVNSNDYVDVEVTLLVGALNTNTNSVTPYSTKTVFLQGGFSPTPDVIEVQGVDAPSHGPLSIQVILEPEDCNASVRECNPRYGGKQKYLGSVSHLRGDQTYSSYKIEEADLLYSLSRCCE